MNRILAIVLGVIVYAATVLAGATGFPASLFEDPDPMLVIPGREQPVRASEYYGQKQ